MKYLIFFIEEALVLPSRLRAYLARREAERLESIADRLTSGGR